MNSATLLVRKCLQLSIILSFKFKYPCSLSLNQILYMMLKHHLSSFTHHLAVLTHHLSGFTHHPVMFTHHLSCCTYDKACCTHHKALLTHHPACCMLHLECCTHHLSHFPVYNYGFTVTIPLSLISLQEAPIIMRKSPGSTTC
jgi:hypothetical protein